MTRRGRVVGTLQVALPPFWETTEQSYDQLQLADKYGLITLLFTNLNKWHFSSLAQKDKTMLASLSALQLRLLLQVITVFAHTDVSWGIPGLGRYEAGIKMVILNIKLYMSIALTRFDDLMEMGQVVSLALYFYFVLSFTILLTKDAIPFTDKLIKHGVYQETLAVYHKAA